MHMFLRVLFAQSYFAAHRSTIDSVGETFSKVGSSFDPFYNSLQLQRKRCKGTAKK